MYRIKDLREDRDLNQAEIAKIIKTTQQQYSKYENETNEIPVRHVVTLCKFYQISADWLLGLSEK